MYIYPLNIPVSFYWKALTSSLFHIPPFLVINHNGCPAVFGKIPSSAQQNHPAFIWPQVHSQFLKRLTDQKTNNPKTVNVSLIAQTA